MVYLSDYRKQSENGGNTVTPSISLLTELTKMIDEIAERAEFVSLELADNKLMSRTARRIKEDAEMLSEQSSFWLTAHSVNTDTE